MAVYIAGEDAGGIYLSRTSGPTNNSFSASFWFKPGTLSGTYRTVFGQTDYIAITTENTKLGWSSNTSGGTGTATLSTSSWYHIGWTRNGNSQLVYLDGVQELSFSDAGAGNTWGLGKSSYVGYGTSFTCAYLKWWDAVLSQTEIQQEMWSARPQRFTNLWAWYPFLSSTTADSSGNGRNWTATGSPTRADGPSAWWGTTSYRVQRLAGGVGPVGYSLPGYYL